MSLVAKIHEKSPISQWFTERNNPAVEGIIHKTNRHLNNCPLSPQQSTHKGLIKATAVYAFLKYLAYINQNSDWLNQTFAYKYLSEQLNLTSLNNKPTTTIRDEAIDCLINAALDISRRTCREHEFLKPFIQSWKRSEEPDFSSKWNKEWKTTINEAQEIVGNIARCWQAVNSNSIYSPIPNPIFELSGQIGGAQADIIVDNILVSLVTDTCLTKIKFQETIAYLLLDSNDKYKIEQITWVFPLRQTSIVIGVDKIFRDINKTRAQFKLMIDKNYPSDEFDEETDLFQYANEYC